MEIKGLKITKHKTGNEDDDITLKEALKEFVPDMAEHYKGIYKAAPKKDKTKIIFFLVWSVSMFLSMVVGVFLVNFEIKTGFIFMIIGAAGWFGMIIFFIAASKIKEKKHGTTNR